MSNAFKTFTIGFNVIFRIEDIEETREMIESTQNIIKNLLVKH